MKKTISLILAFVLVFSVVGCKSSGKVLDYNLDEYVTLAPYSGLTIDKNSTEYKMGIAYSNYANLQNIGEMFDDEELTEGNVQEIDTVNIDYIGKKDGIAFDGGTAEGYELTIGSSSFIKGFELGLIGKKVGETVDLNLTFPEDYSAKELAGEDVVFTVTINSIRRPILPEITDDLAKKLGFDTATAYNKGLEEAYVTNLVWTNAVQNATVINYPEKELEDYIEDNMKAVKKEAEESGTTLEKYLSSNGLTEEIYREYLVDYAKSFVLQKMIFDSISRKENIEVSDEELASLIKENYGSADITEEDRLWVYEKALQEKVCEFLISKASIA